MRRVIRILFVVFVLSILLSLIKSPTFGRGNSFDVQYWSAPDHTRIVILIEEIIYWNTVESEQPNILILEICSPGTPPSRDGFP